MSTTQRDFYGRKISGAIVYDDQYGHVCSCTEVGQWNDDGSEQHTSYLPTVHVDRSVEPTEGGSYWYACDRCGAGAWSGA